MKAKMTWRQRLASDRGIAQVKPIPPRMQKKAGQGTIVIPALREVYDLIRKVPKGRLTTVQQLSDRIALKHHTNVGCTVTTGILAWMVANIGYEEEHDAIKRPAPYWRVLKGDGELNPKYPGGIAALRERLKSEGHSIIADKRRYRVDNFAARLARI